MIWIAASLAAQPPPNIDNPVDTRADSPADAAVIVANERYFTLPEVPFAQRDAELVAETLRLSKGVPPPNLFVLQGANREQILGAVEQAAAKVGDGGTLWFYFAGHGAASPSDGSLLLVGDDAKPSAEVFVARSASLSEITERAGNVDMVTILDTCWAGYGRGGQALTDGRFAVPVYATQATKTLWTATGPDQIAGPYSAARHGLFTYFAMAAFRGWADTDGDGSVGLTEANAWVNTSLQTLQVRDQTPSLQGGDGVVLVSGSRLEPPPDLAVIARPSKPEVGGTEVAATREIPAIAKDVAPTISFVDGAFRDGNNVKLGMGSKVLPIARYDLDGRKAVRRWKLAPVAVGGAAVLAGGGGYVAYLFGWDTFVGKNNPGSSGAIFGAATVGAIGGAALGAHVISRTKKRRKNVLDAANRVVEGKAL